MSGYEGMASPAELVERFYEVVWNRADERAAREILHPGFAFRASLGPERRGPEGFIAYMQSMHAALGDYSCTIEELLVDGTKAAARMTFAGRHRAEFFGVPATGRRIAWAGAAFFETDGRQITRTWVLGDVDGVKRQLGAATTRVF
jgi:steroid delta-isomerase-like uncharacterized protein